MHVNVLNPYEAQAKHEPISNLESSKEHQKVLDHYLGLLVSSIACSRSPTCRVHQRLGTHPLPASRKRLNCNVRLDTHSCGSVLWHEGPGSWVFGAPLERSSAPKCFSSLALQSFMATGPIKKRLPAWIDKLEVVELGDVLAASNTINQAICNG